MQFSTVIDLSYDCRFKCIKTGCARFMMSLQPTCFSDYFQDEKMRLPDAFFHPGTNAESGLKYWLKALIIVHLKDFVIIIFPI